MGLQTGGKEEWKERRLRQICMADLHAYYGRSPDLRYLFLELTDRCNLHCLHCGSSCNKVETDRESSSSFDTHFLKRKAARDLIKSTRLKAPGAHICLTGGEPLLHPDFWDIAESLRETESLWSLISNAVLIDEALSRRLKECGIYSVSVSLDGDEKEHNRLRQSENAYKKAVNGIRCLVEANIPVQITSVITGRTLPQLERLYQTVSGLGAVSWKVLNMEPIGRARENKELLLSSEELRSLLDFIREKRSHPTSREEKRTPDSKTGKPFRASGKMEITYGCSHFLPLLYEEEVRRTLFFCAAGILIAGIRCNGDIVGCLDIENRKELVQGNIYRDSFWDVWQNRYRVFRRDRTGESEVCSSCRYRFLCGGDSLHTWDFDRKEPRVCFFRDAPDLFPDEETKIPEAL